MKLLGFQFEDYACFDSLFLPVRPGLNVITGRNNSGKTALLRGLTVVPSIPVGGMPQVPLALSSYFREGSTPPSFRFSVCFQLDSSDPISPWITCDAKEWERHVEKRKPQVAFTFRVWAQSIAIEEATLLYPDKEIPVVQRRSGQVFDLAYNRHLQTANTSSVAPALSTYSAPDGSQAVILQKQGLFSALDMPPPVLVDPHRVPRPFMALASVIQLPGHANELAPFLQTLHGTDRESYERIERFITAVFPEFKYLNTPSINNQVSIAFQLRTNGASVPLTHCGTGVEQLLVLGTVVVTSPSNMLLLDEPHSFLHPSAERELVAFLQENPQHTYVISTHSPVIINEVSPDRITHLEPPGTQVRYYIGGSMTDTSNVLRDLGYHNSDFVFNDRLLFVEGESDQSLVPQFLERSGMISMRNLQRTGFPQLGGCGPMKAKNAQTSLMLYEKILEEIGRAGIPRVYLFDGDCSQEDRNLLEGTKGGKLSVRFLPRLELENYLLVPEAISKAISEEAERLGIALSKQPTGSDLEAALNELLASDDAELFPRGKGGDPLVAIKGSLALELIYKAHDHLVYHKKRSGQILAKHITTANQPALAELARLMVDLFPPSEKAQ